MKAEEYIDKKYPDKDRPTGIGTKEMAELLESYARQEAVEFELRDPDADREMTKKMYDEWKLNNKP